MKFPDMRIGWRLGLGFGAILLTTSAMLAGAMLTNASSRASLLATLGRVSAKQDAVETMRRALLSSAVSVRNMGLQSKVEGVQKDEAQAKRERQVYLEAKTQLEASGMTDRERAILRKLTDIDRQTEVHFKDAVDLASQFNTDQASAVITGKIDPLLNQAMQELGGYYALQKQQGEEATAQAHGDHLTTVKVISAISALLLAFGAIMAWRLTVSITHPLAVAVQAADRVAQGNLVSSLGAKAQGEVGQLLAALLEMRNGLSRLVGEVRDGADHISTGANEISAGNSDLSQRTETQAANLEQTAASMHALSDRVQSNAHTAREANQTADAASAAATQGGLVMGQVIATMDDITAANRKIADIIGVIDGIAFQTNILALNAAVEAARAGEQGRGFAVVASEVRSLAQHSAEAAKEIKSLIGASVEKIETGSRLVGSAGSSMHDIVTQVARVADLIATISASANEQTNGINQINQAITQLDNVTQQNAALVEQAAAAAASLNQQAVRLVEVVSVFKLS